MGKLIDANVILRYLLNDHPQFSETARMAVEAGAYTLPEVLAEVVYVLKGVYKVERKVIADTLMDFMSEVEVANQDIIMEALTVYSETTLDFVDCILIAYHQITGADVMSFDKKLNKKLK